MDMYLDWTHAYKRARTYAPLVAHKNYWFFAQKSCAESNTRKMPYKYFTIMSKLIKNKLVKVLRGFALPLEFLLRAIWGCFRRVRLG